MTTYLKPGDLIGGRYQVIKPISQGGMGAVYLAEQTSLGREVAIKVILEGVKDADTLRRFDLEAKAVCLLKHPNIITYHDYGRDDGDTPYIVMEYLSGYPASKLFEADSPVTLEVLCHVMSQMCSALGEAHRKGIVHRDLKWSNIMVCPQAHDPYFAKLIDFGIVKIPADHAMKQGLTQTGMLLGTPQYMPPEAIQGKKVDGRADQYSLAVMMWEGIEGVKPYEADSMFEVFRMHVQDPVPGFQRGKKYLEAFPGLEEVVLKGMAKNPDDRFEDILAFQAAIHEVMGLSVGPTSAELARTSLPGGIGGVPGSGRMRGGTGLQPFDTRLRAGPTQGRQKMPVWALVAIIAGIGLAGTAAALAVLGGEDPAAEAVLAGGAAGVVERPAPDGPVKDDTPPVEPVDPALATGTDLAPPSGEGEGGPDDDQAAAGDPVDPIVTVAADPVGDGSTDAQDKEPPGDPGQADANNAAGAAVVDAADKVLPDDKKLGDSDKVIRTPTPPPPPREVLPRTRPLVVTVRPWGYVSINGQDLGQSPISKEFATNRTYRIVVTNPSLGRKERSVRLVGDKDNRPQRVVIDLNE